MTYRILMVEDNVADRTLMRRRLAQSSLELDILEANDGRSGLALLETEAIDCLLLDYQLPDCDGLAFIDSLIEQQDISALPIIMLTGIGRETVAVEAMKRGVVDYLPKDGITSAALQRSLSHALELAASRRERNRAEAALRQSEEHFRDLVEGSVQGIAISRDGVPVFVNASYATLFGYDNAEEILGLGSLDSLYAPSDRLRIKGYRASWRKGVASPADFSYQGVRKDGAMIWVDTRIRLVNWQGEPAVQATIVDITARQRAEEELHLRTAAVEAATDGIIIADARAADQPILYASRTFCSLTGYSEDEILGQNCRFLQGPETNREVIDQLKQALHDKQSFSHEILNYRKDGTPFWNLLRIAPLTDAAGRVQYFVGTQTDISQRKQMEQALYREKERLQITLHSIGDGVITTDAKGRVEFMNPIAESLTGWLIAEARGQRLERIFHIVHEGTMDTAPNPVMECLQEKRVVNLASNTVLISRHGDRYGIQDSAAPICSPEGELWGAVLVFQDVTEARGLAQKVEYQARHDALTGLLNRREFEVRLERALANAQEEGKQHVLCMLDLDNFKIVNDTAGHVAGDALLKQIAHLLESRLRARDSLARLGGDEFCLLLESCPPEKAQEIAETLVDTIRSVRFTWDDHIYEIGVSIGTIVVDAEVDTVAELLTQADVACYAAKGQGRNRVVAYHADDGDSTRRHREMLRAAGLRNALEKDRFCLYAQRIAPLANKTGPVHYEMLLRLQDEDGELLSPGAFIPAAERYHLMEAIDRWVIETVLQQYGPLFGLQADIGVAINLSGNSLDNDDLLHFVREQLVTHNVPPERVCFEITETAAISNLAQATRLMAALKETGCKFALDDFGSGLSSFSYLKQFPVDYLKIDGSFVTDIVADKVDRAMVESINNIGHVMGIQTIAEWVEDQAIIQVLSEIGVDYAQGYTVGRPIPLAEVAAELPMLSTSLKLVQ